MVRGSVRPRPCEIYVHRRNPDSDQDTRSHGRCRQGRRLRIGYPHSRHKTTTLAAKLRKTGMFEPDGTRRTDQRRLAEHAGLAHFLQTRAHRRYVLSARLDFGGHAEHARMLQA